MSKKQSLQRVYVGDDQTLREMADDLRATPVEQWGWMRVTDYPLSVCPHTLRTMRVGTRAYSLSSGEKLDYALLGAVLKTYPGADPFLNWPRFLERVVTDPDAQHGRQRQPE